MPSFEQNPKGYSAEQIAEFEKSRLDENKAHDEANMLTVEQGINWDPSAKDYDESLALLEQLQEEANQGSDSIDKATRPLRNALAGVTSVPIMELLGLALVGTGTTVGPYPKRMAEKARKDFMDKIREVPTNYKFSKEELSTARERLQEWKKEAEELARSQQDKSIPYYPPKRSF